MGGVDVNYQRGIASAKTSCSLAQRLQLSNRIRFIKDGGGAGGGGRFIWGGGGGE